MCYLCKITLLFSALLLFSFTLEAQTASGCSAKVASVSCTKAPGKETAGKQTTVGRIVKSIFSGKTGCTTPTAGKDCDQTKCDPKQCEPKKDCNPKKCQPCPASCAETVAEGNQPKNEKRVAEAGLASTDQG